MLLFGAALVATLLFKHLSYPLLWQDEGETAMYAERVLRFGYPKVHGDRNVLYEFGSDIAVGIDESRDAYIGTTWGHFYFAVPGALAARAVSDPYAKTLRLRLPFALAGAAGIALWLVALARVFRGEPRRARLFAGLFLLATAGSTSLLLHLREARYYGLLLLLTAGVAAIHLRRRLEGRCRGPAWTVAQALLLALVFHTFFAAWFFLVALLTLEGLWSALRSNGDGAQRARRALAEVAPCLLSALFVAPGLVFFETLQNAMRFSDDVGLSFAGYLDNVRFFIAHFATHELLVPAAVCRAAVAAVALAGSRHGRALADDRLRVTARLLAWFVVGYAALTCLNPLVYERYFVVLAPAVTAVFLLDSFTLYDLARELAGEGGGRRAGGGLLRRPGGARARDGWRPRRGLARTLARDHGARARPRRLRRRAHSRYRAGSPRAGDRHQL